MNRDSVKQEILSLPYNNILAMLPTSFGKSYIGIKWCEKHHPNSILIVVPRLVLIQNWKDEFIKWGKKELLDKVTFSTYAGIHKVNKIYECTIFDEAHHISPRVVEIVKTIKSPYNILLSATVKAQYIDVLKRLFNNLYCYRISAKEAINNNILPDPKVFLLPLTLDTKHKTETIILHPNGKLNATCSYEKRWEYFKKKNVKVTIQCTESQKYLDMSGSIERLKNMAITTGSQVRKNQWLHKAGERLKWLSNLKNAIIPRILLELKDERVLTFCNSIQQTEILGKNCINSKNKKSAQTLKDFNNGLINHITACNMVNEGVNLSNCRIGLYANLNSSDVIIIQRLGRILRHPSPIIIIPYFKHTRDEEIVKKMTTNYNPELIYTIKSIKDIKL